MVGGMLRLHESGSGFGTVPVMPDARIGLGLCF